MNNKQIVEHLQSENERLKQLNTELIIKNTELEIDNMKLNDTVEWMHDLIWDTFQRLKTLEKTEV